MKRAGVASAMLLAALSARQGTAQNNHVIRFDPGDSVLTIRVGASASVNVVDTVDCQGMSSYDITLFYDVSRIQLAAANAIPLTNVPAPTVTLYTDSARIVSSGGTGFVACGKQPFVNLTFAMSGGAATGSLVSMHVNHMIDGVSQDVTPFTVTGLLDICQAIHSWGDLDDNGLITSRDALVALTGAVGLPTTGFDLTLGDVDGDGVVTARDALYILSDGVGLGPGDSRSGAGIPNHCAPLAPAPSDLLYWTHDGNTLARVAAGDTIPVVLNPGIVSDVSYSARFSPDGGKIAYVCFDPQDAICTADRDGGHVHDLVVGSGGLETQPVWSPDGQQIAFVDQACCSGVRSIWVADSTGLNGHAIVTGQAVLELGGWSSAGLVFTVSSGGRRLMAANADGTNVHEVFTNSFLESPADPGWSPAADSVAFTQTGLSNNDGSLTVVSATSLQQGVRGGQLTGLAETPSWLTAGFGFRAPVGSMHEVVLQTVSGRYLRLTRSTNPDGASRPSFR